MSVSARLRTATSALAWSARCFAIAVVVALAWQAPARAADIQQVRSPGGIAAWLVQEKSLPIVAIRFGFDGGSAQEPMGKEGTAGLLAAMLDQGAGDLSS